MALFLCAASTASCSRDSLGSGKARDAATDQIPGTGGLTGAGGATGSGGIVGVGGVTGSGGLAAGGLSSTASASRTGGTTGAGGMPGSGGAKGSGGTPGVGGFPSSGGASGGTVAPILDGSIAPDGAGGVLRADGAVGSGGTASGGSSAGGVTGSSGSADGGGGAGGSISDGAVDAAVDVPARPLDTYSVDMPSYSDYNKLLGGIWLVGWSGGLRHYSWVRLSGTPGGAADFLAGDNLPSNTPYWSCIGQGTWNPTAAPYAMMLSFPSSCPSGLSAYFKFQGLPDPPTLLPGATFGMIAPSTSRTDPPTEWWKFPGSQCDELMAVCKSPF
jgi:hypothetical protein